MIIYFSGSGNSLSVAKDLAQALEEKAIHINQALKLNKIEDKRIGFVYPTYGYDMPRAMQKSIKKLSINSEAYVFGVATHGGNPGNCLYTLKSLLGKTGVKLSYGAEIRMPVSSRVAYGGKATDIEELVSKQRETIKGFVKDIKSEASNAEKLKEKRVLSMMANLANKPALAEWMFKKTVDPDRCVKCGTCVKICPTSNIRLGEKGIEFSDKCTDCLACIHWCPQAAIGIRKRKVKKDQQYHHPDISVQEMIQK